jgi:glycerophosphoryl diester phosphodiesterase
VISYRFRTGLSVISPKDLSWLTARPIAHRGYHDAARGRPENTLAAFDAAAAAGYAIECDLQLAADQIPVVFHDDELTRLTGQAGPVTTRTAKELGRLKVLGSMEKIPTLDELLTLVAGRVPLVIELKHSPGREARLARETVLQLRQYAGPAALMSFDPALLAAARAAGWASPLGLTAHGNWRSAARHSRAILNLHLDFISYAIDDLPTPLPVLANQLMRMPLISWTVRTKLQLEKAKRWTDQITFEGFRA